MRQWDEGSTFMERVRGQRRFVHVHLLGKEKLDIEIVQNFQWGMDQGEPAPNELEDLEAKIM